MGELLSVNDAAQRFGFSTKYIYALIQAGELKSLKRQGRTLIDPEDLASVSGAQQAQRPYVQETVTPQPTPDEPNPLLDYLYEVVADQKQQLLQLQAKLEQCQNDALKSVKDAYAKKDEQLQQYMVFLNNSTRELIASTLDLSVSEPLDTQANRSSVDVPLNEVPVKVLLNDYLAGQGYDKKQRKKIYARCQNAFLEDSTRFHVQKKKLYIYPYEYVYDDLL